VKTNKDVFFLKELAHARNIRKRMIECFERAENPHITDEERKRLLTFLVVGGGPTSVEFAAEAYDFIKEDVSKWYPDLKDLIKIQLIGAAPALLDSFNRSLGAYVQRLFDKRGIETSMNCLVSKVHEHSCDILNIKTQEIESIPFGLMVWSTGFCLFLVSMNYVLISIGVKQVPFIDKMNEVVHNERSKRLVMNPYLQTSSTIF